MTRLTEDDPISIEKEKGMWSAFDLQCNQYFEAGRNSATPQECIDEVIPMLLEGSEFNESEFESQGHILQFFQVRIERREKL